MTLFMISNIIRIETMQPLSPLATAGQTLKGLCFKKCTWNHWRKQILELCKPHFDRA